MIGHRESLFRFAKSLGLEGDDMDRLWNVLEMIGELDVHLALRHQDDLEVGINYLRAKYVRLRNLAERDYKVLWSQSREAMRDSFTSPRGALDSEGLDAMAETDENVLAAHTERERLRALADLLWGLYQTIYKRRDTLREVSTNMRMGA